MDLDDFVESGGLEEVDPYRSFCYSDDLFLIFDVSALWLNQPNQRQKWKGRGHTICTLSMTSTTRYLFFFDRNW